MRDLLRQCLIEADGGNGEARIRGNSCVQPSEAAVAIDPDVVGPACEQAHSVRAKQIQLLGSCSVRTNSSSPGSSHVVSI